MRKADVYMQGKLAGVLQEIEKGKHYRFIYLDGYADDLAREMLKESGIEVSSI